VSEELKPESYFDHDADIGIIGRGKTLEESFEDAAYAMFALMSDLSLVKETQTWHFEFEEDDIELAFVTWLNLLLALSNASESIFSRFEIKKSGSHWQGHAWGEAWREDLIRGIDVKGATLSMLSVKQENGIWQAQCIVDV